MTGTWRVRWCVIGDERGIVTTPMHLKSSDTLGEIRKMIADLAAAQEDHVVIWEMIYEMKIG